MIPKTHTVVPFLIAMYVAVAGMPTNVYQICRRAVGTLEVEPWLDRSSATIVHAVSAVAAWILLALRARVPAFCTAAVLLALLVADLSASHAGVVMLATVVPAVAVTSGDSLRQERELLVRESAALKGENGEFVDADAKQHHEIKAARIASIDVQLRELEKPADEAAIAAAAAAERVRITSIQGAVRFAKLESSVADDMVKRGITVEAARAEIFAKLESQQAQTPTTSRISTVPGEDARDKWLRGQMNWLLVRSGLAGLVAKHEGVKESDVDPGEFRGMSLLDIAKETLTRANITFRGKDRMDIAGLAFRGNYQTTSDFAVLLENTMHKILRAAYALQPDTWSRWCGTATVSDFRTHNWYRMGSLTELEGLTEHGEFKNKSIPDGEKATYSVGTKGNIIAITRQTIVNDDLGSMTRLTGMLGRAGKLTIEKRAYALLGQNSGLGPTQSDSQPLFHSNRSNVGTGAALGVAGLDADRVVMGSQLDPNGQDYLDLRPDVLLVPLGLGGQARVFNSMEFDDTSNKFMKPNVVRGLFREVVDTPRLSGTRRYLFADRNTAPVFLVSFLEGNQEPVLETQDGWRTDGVELKARLDFGVDVVDYRGAVTNAGV